MSRKANERADVVIIGGGVIGLSVAYHLGQLPAGRVLLLERNTLTSGTSWHAAGIVGPLRASLNLTRLARYGVSLFQELEAETGQATGYRQTGGLWLASSQERLTELRRIKAMGDMSGLDTAMLSADETRERAPLLRVDDLAGALWVEQDGQVNPVDLCMAYAKGARARGVEIRERAGVAGVGTERGAVAGVDLVDGAFIECRKVINCAGTWARDLALQAGVNVPLQGVEHLYVVTDPIPEVVHGIPVIRDLDRGIYIKGDAGKLVIGTFEPNPKLWDPRNANPSHEYLMFDEDYDHIEPMLEAALERVPSLAHTGLSQFVNGPESFTPDTRQLMGEAPELRNYFVAAGFNSIGIMSSAGVGRAMAEWVTQGEPPMDLWEVDIGRMDPLSNEADFLRERTPESVHNQFAMHWPYKQFRTARNLRTSIWHSEMDSQGAVFGAPGGWERPLWFAQREEPRSLEYSYGCQAWWPVAAREARHLMEHVSLFELSPFGKFRVKGADACELLQRLCSNDVDVAEGRVIYTLVLNPRGGIDADLTVNRIGEREYFLVGGAATRFRDLARLRRAAVGRDVEISDETQGFAVAGLMGPSSRALLQTLVDDDLSNAAFPFGTSKPVDIGSARVMATRISFVGELGYELYVPTDQAGQLYRALVGVGEKHRLGHAGHFCLDACRLEKAYRHWGHDIGPDDSPLETGLGFAVAWDKSTEFHGGDAVRSKRVEGVERRNELFQVTGEAPLLLHDEPVYLEGRLVGRTTSGGLGFRTNRALCFASVAVEPGTSRRELENKPYEVELAGERYPLRMLLKAPYDPQGTRLRS